MILNKNDISVIRNLKQEVFEVPEWNGEVVVRELSITEAEKYKEMISEDKPLQDIIKYACSCTMLEPTMSADEDLTDASPTYILGLNQIFNNIPVIGKTKEQKEDFFKKQIETFKASQKKPELTKEEEEKK